MDRAFAKHDRVRLSEKGRKVYPRHYPPDRVGTVVHEPVRGYVVSVKWDGAKTKTQYNHLCLEHADAATK